MCKCDNKNCSGNCGGSCQIQIENDYTGSDFPIKKGSRSEAVRALQRALNTKFNLPANMKLTEDTAWGAKTQAAIEYLGLPSVIANEGVLKAIQAGQNPTKAVNIASGVAANFGFGLFGANNSGSSEKKEEKEEGVSKTTDSWKESVKDPNKAADIFTKFTQGIANLRKTPQNQYGYQNQYGQYGYPQQQQRRLPIAAWIAIGLVVLLLLGFVIYKAAK